MAKIKNLNTTLADLGFNTNGERQIIQHDLKDEIVDVDQNFPDLSFDDNKIQTLNVSKLLAGIIKSKAITLDVEDGTGDSKIQAGKTDFDNTENGFIIGIDDSDSNKVKLYIGDSNYYLNLNGSDFTLKAKNSNLMLYEAVVDAAGYGDYTNIQDALDAGKTKIYVRAGTYEISSAINSTSSNIKIIGESKMNTTIRLSNGSDCNMIDFGTAPTTPTSVEIRNFTFNGNSSNQTSTSHGINLINCSDFLIQDCYLNDIRDASIITSGTSSLNRIYNNYITNCTQGIYCLDSQGRHLIYGNIITSCDYGILLDDSPFNNISASNYFSENGYAVFIEGTSQKNIINSNLIFSSTNQQIWAGTDSGYDDVAVITSNIIYNGSSSGIGSTSNNNRLVISNNWFNENTNGALDASVKVSSYIINNTNCENIENSEIHYMYNDSGGNLVKGDIIVLKTDANGNKFTTTTTQGDKMIYGVLEENINNGEWGRIKSRGYTESLKVNGTNDIAIGDYITTYTSAGIGCKATDDNMAIAIALEAYSTDDSNGIINALMITPRQVNGNVVLKSLIDAKGDLIVGTDDNTPARLAVGTNDYVLTADSEEEIGMKWAQVSGFSAKVGQGSRAINTTGSQVITHNLGITPKIIKIWATAYPGGTGLAYSQGNATSTSDETSSYSTLDGLNGVRATGQSNSYIIYLVEQGGTLEAGATLSAVSTTTFTLNWITNSANGTTRYFQWEVLG